jgi:hypothetical protein
MVESGARRGKGQRVSVASARLQEVGPACRAHLYPQLPTSGRLKSQEIVRISAFEQLASVRYPIVISPGPTRSTNDIVIVDKRANSAREFVGNHELAERDLWRNIRSPRAQVPPGRRDLLHLAASATHITRERVDRVPDKNRFHLREGEGGRDSVRDGDYASFEGLAHAVGRDRTP